MKELFYCLSLLLLCACGVDRQLIRPAQEEPVGLYLGKQPDIVSPESFVQKLATVYDKDSVLQYIGQNALDEKTGEQIMTVGLQDVQITARARNLALRGDEIKIEFLVTIPETLLNRQWELQLFPCSDKVDLLPMSFKGEQFAKKQQKQYELFASLSEVVFADWQTGAYINTAAMEKEIARQNSRIRREARLKKESRFQIAEYRLANYADTLAVLGKYIDKKKVERNEYLKKVLSDKFPGWVTLEKLEPLLIDTVVPSGELITCLYSIYVPSKGVTGRIPVAIKGNIRILNGEIVPVPGSDSLVFSLSSLTDLLLPDLHADNRVYQEAVNLLRDGNTEEAMRTLDRFQDCNRVIGLLCRNRNYEALELLRSLDVCATSAYLYAIAASRIGEERTACEKFLEACQLDSSKKWRGNLDPEISYLIKKYGLDKEEDDY